MRKLIMRHTPHLILGLFIELPAIAQEQQSGNEASTNTEEISQVLFNSCGDADALMLRA